MNILKKLDLFDQNVTLYTKSSSKIATLLGFSFTILSVILFMIIFYLEAYEVFKRETPNVASYKQNLNKNNSTLTFNKNTFNFYINLRSIDKETLLKNFKMRSEYNFKDEWGSENVPLEECNANDKAQFSYFLGEGFEFDSMGYNLCPRIDFTKLDNKNRFKGMEYEFSIFGCSGDDPDCIRDEELYRYFHEESIGSYFYFVDSERDLTNYTNPYSFDLNDNFIKTKRMTIKLEGSEITTESLFSFNKFKTSQFNVLSTEESKISATNTFFSLKIVLDSKDMIVYHRTYKTLNSAFANSFALFKLITWLLKKMLKPYYGYYMNTIIMNKNFNYGESIQNFNHVRNKNVDSDMTVELTGNKKTKKLTTFSVIKNVSPLRYILCRGRNRTQLFYTQAEMVMSKHLSIENLFKTLIEYFKLKQFLLSANDAKALGSGNKLVLGSELGIDKENLKLENLLSNTDLNSKENTTNNINE
jgi:hypothetical protein